MATTTKRKAGTRKARHWSSILVRLGACTEARKWAARQPSLAAAWRTCDRSGWMRWWLSVMVPAPTHKNRSACPACQLAMADAHGLRRLYPKPPMRRERP